MQILRRLGQCVFVATGVLGMAGCGMVEPVHADVRVPAFISDNMVLQRDTNVPLWGWAADGEKVTVRLQGQEVSGIAQNGKWRVVLAPLKAGGPFAMTITGANTLEFKNVLVGEVWISCGQSNMMMSLNSVENGMQAVEESSGYPDIHFITTLDQAGEAVPQENTKSAGWSQANPNSVGSFSAVSYFFGRALQKRLKVPIGLINNVAVMPAEAWVDAQTLQGDAQLAALPEHPLHAASKSFNAMIAPLGDYALRGAIYYQGEYNAGRGKEFRRLMPAVIRSWRKQWGRDFPFLFVQLPGFNRHLAEADKKLDMPAAELAALQAPGQSSAWAEMREAQLMTYKSVPNTGMAIAIDLGDPQDIHPRKKQQVGERLAIAARAVAYGEKIADTGPILSSIQGDGQKVILNFRNAGASLKCDGGELRGFEVAGKDHHFFTANATIDGPRVVLSCPQVAVPAKVRYAWANYPAATLFNSEGLPASPFRGDLPGTVAQLDAFSTSWPAPIKAGPAAFDVRQTAVEWDQKWNADIADSNNVRPGTIYKITFKAKKAGENAASISPYLTTPSTMSMDPFGSSGSLVIDSADFQDYVQAGIRTSAMSTAWDGNLSMRMYGGENEAVIESVSPIEWLRPKLLISDSMPINLGTVKPLAKAESAPRAIVNGQDGVFAAKAVTVSTVLYGAAHITAPPQTLWQQSTDHVGAEIIGANKELFEIVSSHPGATAREMKLMGADGKDGLHGGPQPEREEFFIRFNGAGKAGIYTATLRIVTQAGNTGVLSEGLEGEPLEGLFYVNLPIKVEVKN